MSRYDPGVSIDVGVSALRANFDALLRAGRLDDTAGTYLLRFYAVECGLKAAILLRSKGRSTAQLPSDLRNHDLQRLARFLKLAPATYQGIVTCERHDNSPPVAPHQVHEAWRYGARLLPAAEEEFVTGLDLLIKWCQKELQR